MLNITVVEHVETVIAHGLYIHCIHALKKFNLYKITLTVTGELFGTAPEPLSHRTISSFVVR